MDSEATPDSDVRVLLVGPGSWQEAVQPSGESGVSVSTRAVETVTDAVAVLDERSEAVDCVVTAGHLRDDSAVALLTELQDSNCSVPVVLAPSEGSEALASEAVEAGVADYVPIGSPGDETDAESNVHRRLVRAVSRHRERRQRDETAAQFEALFAADERFVVVLDPSGTVERANSAALRYLACSEDTALGMRFWAFSWANPDGRRTVQAAVERGRDGSDTKFEARLASGGTEIELEFTVHPVDDDGRVVGLVVEGKEVEERVRLEEELRESEELHRVTLNNMTDTVLITDDDGQFTYVCPNVHFIFGYTAEEIREFGTIDALLGDDLFDRATLDSEGVLTNIECTATDKNGDEHVLLVNVRNVSIQGGTTLFSCRDITKRKQREEALTQLHHTSRDLLYAGTKSDVADRVVTDAASLLPAASALYLFDREKNVLRPTAVSETFASAVDPLPELDLYQGNGISHAFVEEETTSSNADEVEGAGAFPSNLADYVAVPLGDHGVFVAASSTRHAFDEMNEEIAELLAATTEAAFDRIEQESEIRERDETLQRRNRRLSQVNQVNGIIREIDQALVRAEDRETIEQAVCERLTTDERFSFAWISEATALNQTLRPRAWAGDERGYLDAVSFEFDGNDETLEPTVRSAERRDATFVSNVADHLRSGAWPKAAISRDFQCMLAIPLLYDGVLFGTLGVYADRPKAFDEMVRSVLHELGDTIASAINAVQRKEALRSDAVVELDYEISDSSAILLRLAREVGCSVAVEGDVTRGDGGTVVFAAVEGVRPEAFTEAADEAVGVTEAESIRTTEDGGSVKLEIPSQFLTTVLADHGAALREFRATSDGLHLSVDVPDSVTTRTIDEVVSNTYDETELVTQRKRTRSLETTVRGRFFDELTERQREVAQMAYHSGFFDESRSVTGEELASMLDISPAAFYDHVRRIRRKLFASMFESSPQPGMVE